MWVCLGGGGGGGGCLLIKSYEHVHISYNQMCASCVYFIGTTGYLPCVYPCVPRISERPGQCHLEQ